MSTKTKQADSLYNPLYADKTAFNTDVDVIENDLSPDALQAACDLRNGQSESERHLLGED